jgi:AAHS family 3-hydroxyphenylpropionic acid transporter
LSATTSIDPRLLRRSGVTLALCFSTAVIEGLDLQSMAIAVPGLAPEFHLSKQALGPILMASPAGLFFGAFIGGRSADFWGRKNSLLLAIATFGLFQLATAWAPGYASLLAIRFLCGLGLGGALPNLIALTSEASEGRNNILNVVITAAGMPTGGALASLIGFLAGANGDWRIVFYIGGIAPLVLTPVMALTLPESRLFQEAKAVALTAAQKLGILHTLFAKSRASATILLWIAFFFTSLVIYLLLNWLPQLMIAKGFAKTQAFLIQVLFNVGAATGSIALGWLMQRWQSRILLFTCYVGVAASLLLIASLGHDLVPAACAAASVGAFLLGAQYILYGVCPSYYLTQTRGTGTGAAVAVGRLGSAMGPLLGSQLLGAGASATHVLQSLLPVTGVAAAAAVFLLFLKRPDD